MSSIVELGLIGHSEGGMISSIIAAESTDVAFVVLMAGVVQADIDGLVIQTARQLKADGASQELLDQDTQKVADTDAYDSKSIKL